MTILGAVSPPGGDLTEPVTSHTRRFVRAVWSLDRDLAYARHYPAVSWRDSSARDVERLAAWQAENGDPGWGERRARALRLLTDADRIESIAQLVGTESLPARERITLRTRAPAARGGPAAERRCSRTTSSPRRPSSVPCSRSCSTSTTASPACSSAACAIADLDAVDLSGVLRARYDTAPDGAAEVEQIGQTVVEALEAVGEAAR